MPDSEISPSAAIGQSGRWSIAATIVVNIIAPYVIYIVLEAHMSRFGALLCSSIPPLLQSVASVIRRRRIDTMAALVLSGIALSLLLIALGGSARLLLIRESLLTGVFGVVFLASLLLPRPLIFYLARQNDMVGEGGHEYFELRWQNASFRRAMRLITALWGAGLLVEAAVRTVLAETLSISRFLLISPFVQFAIMAALAGLTIIYVRRLKSRSDTEVTDDASSGV
ncbi:VC0807 family protein [Salinisphaera sp. SPP-AMP-43]|uniref:VC0807 family protein n=1 Tax=Salinisphaera sp. SPP-AMP-43 TaxID=3121288 RepID=UPI003C6E5496